MVKKEQDESKKKKKNTDDKSKSIERVKKAEETKEKTQAESGGSVVKKEQHKSNVDEDSQETSEKKKKTIKEDKQKSFENSPEPEPPEHHSSPKKIGSVKSVDGISDSNYARIAVLAPCDKDTCVLKGAPKECGIRAYEKLAASHTRVLKKVSDLAPSYEDGFDSNDSNTVSNYENNAMFSTVLKIVEYSDSETSPSKVLVTGTPENAERDTPQHAYYKHRF